VLRRALELDPASCEATASLGVVLEAKHEDREAMAKLQDALQCHYSKELADALFRVRMRNLGGPARDLPPPSDVPPLLPFPLVEPPPVAPPQVPTPAAAPLPPGDGVLSLPAFPDWPDINAFRMAVPQSKAWADELGKATNDVMNASMNLAGELMKQRLAANARPTPAPDPVTRLFEYAYSDEPAKRAAEVLLARTSRQLSAIEAEYRRELEALDEPFTRKGAMPPQPMDPACPAHQEALKREYQGWRKLTRKRYEETTRVLADYYTESAHVLAQFHAPADRAIADATRKVTVLMQLQGMALDFWLVRPMFYSTEIAFGCMGDVAPPPPAATKPFDPTRTPDAKAGECLTMVKDGGLTIDLYAARFKLTCEKVQIGFDGAFYTGAGAYNYRTGELTVNLGMRFQAFETAAAAAGLPLRARGGLYTTWDTSTGQLVAAGLYESIGAKVNLGSGSFTDGGSYEHVFRQDLMPVATLVLAPFGGTVRNVRPMRP
jgi:hypothetical protein